MGEVWVIGGGMAGGVAALSARRAGAKVVLVRRSLGASAMSSGAIDVASSAGALGPLEAAGKVARLRPDHPYATLEDDLSRLPEALHFVGEQLSELLAPLGERNLLLPTPLGTVKPTAIAQRAQVGADVWSLPAQVAVVEFEANPICSAEGIAKGLSSAARALERPLVIHEMSSRWLSWVADPLSNPFEIAERLDSPEQVDALADDLRLKLPPGTQCVLLPPVLGRRSLNVAERLSARLGVRCSEILSFPPSVPGLRLQETLDRVLDRAGVERIDVEVLRSDLQTGRLELSDERAVSPAAIILATGKFIGGGIERDGRFYEPVFGLPVFADGQPVEEVYLASLLDPKPFMPQPAFAAGVRVDRQLRPISAEGQPVSLNLFAAGAILAGHDPSVDKTGMGVAVLTGYLAGKAAAQLALTA